MKQYILLAAILALSLTLRWYKVDNPIADWHSWRQADTASVSREYVKHGIDLLRPHFQDLSSFPSRIDNPEGYRMVEFPIYNAIHATVADNFAFWNLDKWGRVLSILYSLISIVTVYLLTTLLTNTSTGLLAALFMGILPFNIYYSRVILPDPLMIMLTLLSVYFFVLFTTKNSKKTFLLSAISLSLAILVKPYALFFTLPIIWLSLQKWKLSLLKNRHTYLYLLIAIGPFLLWRSWITQFPAGIPTTGWLYNHDGIRLRPAWWRWIFYERYSNLILGGFGLLPFLVGIITKINKNENYVFHLWLLGCFAYLVIFSGGNVTHDYYQAITIPVIAIFMAKGVRFLTTPNKALIWPITPILTITVVSLSLFFSWYQIKGYYQINNWSIVETGQVADRLLPEDAKVIAPYNGDTAFLYQINRTGWPISIWGIDYLRAQGATHYVSINYDDETNAVINNPKNTIIEKTPQFVIVELE